MREYRMEDMHPLGRLQQVDETAPTFVSFVRWYESYNWTEYLCRRHAIWKKM